VGLLLVLYGVIGLAFFVGALRVFAWGVTSVGARLLGAALVAAFWPGVICAVFIAMLGGDGDDDLDSFSVDD
jgi:hypothetical protein